MPFLRSLDPKIVDALNNSLTSAEGRWWKTLIEDPTVFIAVRKNELNAYSGGASLGRIAWRNNGLSFRVHVEYLVFADRQREDKYFDFLQNSISPEPVIVKNTGDYVKQFSTVKAIAREVASRERRDVNGIAARRKCVLDIEAAFNTLRESKETGVIPETVGGRVDLVAVNQKNQLIFTEAKLLENRDLIGGPIPPVCGQLISYHKWLTDNGEEIQNEYAHQIATCRLNGKFFKRWEAWHERKLVVDTVPRLLIFGDGNGNDLEQIKKQIVQQVRNQVDGFGIQHIRYQNKASDVKDADLL